jgi:hypothetical protein
VTLKVRVIAFGVVFVFVALAHPSVGLAACTSPAAAAGSLNWNTGTTSFQYCDGTAWQNFGIAASFAGGTVGSPGWAITGDTDTGLWAPAANTLSISAGGVEVERWNTVASGVNYLSITPGAVGSPATVTIGAAGTSTDVNIAVTPKGAGYTLLSGKVGVGTTTANYRLDVAGANSQIHISTAGADSGGYIASVASSNLATSGGSTFNGAGWVAKDTSAEIISMVSGGVTIFADASLTAGNTYTPTARMTISSAGNVGIGTATPS